MIPAVPVGARRAGSMPRSATVVRLLQFLHDGLRVALLRPPRAGATIAHAGLFMAVLAVYLLACVLLGFADTSPPWSLSPLGVLGVLGDAMLTLLAAWLLAVLARRGEAVWGVATTLLAATTAVAVVVHWPLDQAIGALDERGFGVLALLLALLRHAWWFFVLLALAHALAPRRLDQAVGAALLAYAVSAATWWWLPGTSPVRHVASSPIAAAAAAAGPADDGAPAPVTREDGEPSFDAEAVMYAQPALLDATLGRLRPQTPGKVDLYVVAFAGDAQEDVFRNEAEYVEALFSRRFGAEGRVVVLQNNEATLGQRPLATWTNLQRTLAALAQRMDPAEDLLLLYLTSHGSEEHELLVDLDPLPLNQVRPADLADALRTTPALRWKVIVVNACYAGGFVDALRDDSTLVLAAARADRTSFGCGADSDITWFGRAFLVDALNETTSIREAFERAREAIAAWEARDGDEHSEPQIATSASIEAKLATWQRTLSPAAPVPFVPASAGDTPLATAR